MIKKRNPLTNNTHTSGVIDKARPHMISGGSSYNNFVKSGVSTPNGNAVKLLERSLKHHNNNNSIHSNGLNGSIEETKYSDRSGNNNINNGKKYLHIPSTNLNIMQSNSIGTPS